MAHCYPVAGQTNYQKDTYASSYNQNVYAENHQHGHAYGHNHGGNAHLNHGTQAYAYNSTNGYGHNHGGIAQNGHFNHGATPIGTYNEHGIVKTHHKEGFSHGIGGAFGTHNEHGHNHGGIAQNGHFNHGATPIGTHNEHGIVKSHHAGAFSHGVGGAFATQKTHQSTKTHHSSSSGIKNLFRRKKKSDGCSTSDSSDSD